MKIFLTGGTGFIGQPLTRALISRGWQVTALVRKPDSVQARALTDMGAQCVTGDVTDRESMRAGMTGTDIVVHNAAWYEIGVPQNARQKMHAINVTGTENVLSLAQELSIPRTIYVSSCTYYGDSGPEARDENFRRQKPYQFFYEQTKAKAHDMALHYLELGLPLVIVCPAHVLGPNDHSIFGYFLRMYLNRLMVPFGFAPDTVFSPAHVDDIAEGIALTAQKGRLGETYILAGDPINLHEIFAIWNSKPGGLKVKFFVPRWLAALMFAPLEPVQRKVGLPAFISRETVATCRSSYNFSSVKAQHELGWTYRPSKEMWQDIFDGEIELAASRQKRDIVSRLRPVETTVNPQSIQAN